MVDSSVERQSGRKLFFGLFIFPLLIAVGMAVLLCTVVLMTREVETPESLITSIKTGSPSKRWQKAFELSNELNQGRGMIREAGVMKEVIHILNDRKEYDPRTRSFMAIALGRFEHPEAVSALQETLRAEDDPDVQLYLMWSLGVREAKDAATEVAPFLKSEQDELRKMAAYVIGVIGNEAQKKPLAALLEDGVRDVRWNAAIALARLGSDAGFGELLKMIDRKTLDTMSELDDAKKEEIMMNAIKALALTGRKESLPVIEKISQNDKSLKVRQVALAAIAEAGDAAA